jgi:DNA-binding transcriptional LysR family regulator
MSGANFRQCNLSITRREADIAVRFARPSKDDGMLCQRVGEIEYAVFTAVGTNPDDLPWLTHEDSTANLPQARWTQYGTVLSREVWLIVHPQIRRLARIAFVMTWIASALSAP